MPVGFARRRKNEEGIALNILEAISFQLLFVWSVRLDLTGTAAIIVPMRMEHANQHRGLEDRYAFAHQLPRHFSQFLGE